MKQPNILLLFTDQQRADTIGALGNPVIKTPNFDRLVNEGTAFTSAYTPSAECVPARCCMTFGDYPGKNKCYGNGNPMPWEKKESFMQALTKAGYYAHGIGKCHFTPDVIFNQLNGFSSREVQEELVNNPKSDDYMRYLQSNGGEHITDPHGVRGEMYYVPQPAQMPAKHHPTQWIGDRSVDFIKNRSTDSQPWFMFSSFIHPHPPFAPPAPWHKLYRDLDVPLPHTPADCEKLLVYINKHQNRYKRRDRGTDLQLMRVMRAYYYACVSFVDYQIGRIITSLEETGQLDNTIIIASSDHGELLGDFKSVGKRSYHDAASRIPMIMRGPGITAGKRCDTPVSLLDVPVTLLNAAGTEFSTHTPDGLDLRHIADNPPDDRTVFSQLHKADYGLYTAVNKRWKFVYSAPDQRELLFDRKAAPGETCDLANVTWLSEWPASRALKNMRNELINWLREQGEEAALDGDNLRVYPKRGISENPDAHMLYQDHSWADQHIPGYSNGD
jgi:arylsulfatase